MFFTGRAGTGKSHVLRRVVDVLRVAHGADAVAVTAPTGLAASHVGGSTLHAALGLGAPRATTSFLSMWAPATAAHLRALRAVVVDEVSMVSAEMLEIVDACLRQLRGDDRPMGGLQLVACGDFHQLPPVAHAADPGTPPEAFLNRGYAFQAPAWARCGFECVVLTTVWRQRDPRFVGLLDAVRRGGRDGAAAVRALAESPPPPAGDADDEPRVHLYARNADVDRTNRIQLARLPGNTWWASATDTMVGGGEAGCGALTDAMCECPAPKSSMLKVGAPVMLLKNLDRGHVTGGAGGSRRLVNGSLGKVVAMMTRTALEQHLDRAGKLSPEHKAVLDSWGTPRTMVPVVKWANGRREPCGPQAFETHVPGVGVARRVQLPVRLAWAMTIHKSQGLSLDRVTVWLHGCYSPGQAYVALSRARTVEGLRVCGAKGHTPRTAPDVRAFEGGQPRDGQAAGWAKLQRIHSTIIPRPLSLASAGSPDKRFCFKCGRTGHPPFACPSADVYGAGGCS